MPIVLSVSRLSQRLDETPGAVTIIDRDAIRRSGARDVVDLMRMVPGFQVSNAFESVAPLTSYHGAFDSYSNRLELLIDGRSAYSPYFIGSTGPGLQSVALEDIDHIEVLRGTNAAAYGARAVLGVINIVTRHTADTLGAQASVTVGENNIRDVQARVGWGDQRATFRLSVDRRADNGLGGSQGANLVQRVNFRSDIRPNGLDEVQLRFGQMTIDAGKGFADNFNDAPRDTYFGSHYVQVDWRRNLGEDADLSMNVSHTDEQYDDSFPYSLKPLGINDVYYVTGSGKASNDSVTLQHTFRSGTGLRVVWGGEFRSERITSRALYNTDSAFMTDFTRLFGNVEWRLKPSVIVNVGAMAERSSVTGESFSPRVMVNWHVTPGQTLRVGVSRAFRPPSNYEKFADLRFVYKGKLLGLNTVSSGKVEPESMLVQEVGYLGNFPSVRMNLDVRVFNEQIGGFIRQQNSTLPRDYGNDEDVSIKGLEYQAKWKPWTETEIVWNQSYTEIAAVKDIWGGASNTDGSGTRYAAPTLASSVSVLQKLPYQIEVALTHHDYGTARLTGAGASSRVAMTRSDVRISKAMRFGEKKGEVALMIQNVGVPYQDFSQRFEFRRQAFVTLRLEN